MINHGTRGGYYAHRRLSSPTCDACRAAINEYVKEYRAKNGLSKNRQREKIRRMATAILREKYPEDYKKQLELCRVEFSSSGERDKRRRKATSALRDAHREEYEELLEQLKVDDTE